MRDDDMSTSVRVNINVKSIIVLFVLNLCLISCSDSWTDGDEDESIAKNFFNIEVDSKFNFTATIEALMPPKYSTEVGSVEFQAHENRVVGCRDHPKAVLVCQRASNPCFCEEHVTYMYSFCRRSCKLCDPVLRGHHSYWRLRSGSSFNPTWFISELEMYREYGENVSLSINATDVFASSEFTGFPATKAVDKDPETYWLPTGWGNHESGDDWIAYSFPQPVLIRSVRMRGNPFHPLSTPNKVLVEASDEKTGPYQTVWSFENKDRSFDKMYFAQECPVLWHRFDIDGQPYCYRLFASYRTWRQARSRCQIEAAELISITKQSENDFIINNLRTCGSVWIGINDREHEGQFVWSDRSVGSYNNWDTDTVYDEMQRHYEDCGLMTLHGKWQTAVCSDRHYFICKKKIDEAPTFVIDEKVQKEEPPFVFTLPKINEPVLLNMTDFLNKTAETEDKFGVILKELKKAHHKELGYKSSSSSEGGSTNTTMPNVGQQTLIQRSETNLLKSVPKAPILLVKKSPKLSKLSSKGSPVKTNRKAHERGVTQTKRKAVLSSKSGLRSSIFKGIQEENDIPVAVDDIEEEIAEDEE